MAMTPDPLTGGPLPPPDVREPLATGERAPAERDEDPSRDEHMLTGQASGALTDEERDAARNDPGRPARTHAPASERVPKDPIGKDADLIEGGHPVRGLSEDAADRSVPEELR